ncbi:ty3-gypsy retrotransposon protein [Cucumis melo var. makuwa]|uniref:Ty3-gypsy retrotransposon protein n=1 Tax=Cucumis melo var. makuwa TaxID=1194695 RepID=A0A5A7T5E6_CUCMM|nr:ty3-gypsy retrotransposon protein [Cucumis melo var. makuwa]
MNGEIHWIGMKNDVKRYVEQCEVCQRNKTEALSPAGLLQPLPLPNLILEDWTMDFIEGLPKAGGYDSIMVVVDRLSKLAHFIPLKHPFTAKQVAEKFVEEIISKHGIPNSIPTKWHKCIPWAELWYNTTFHSSARTTPFQIVYGRPPPPLVRYGDKKSNNNTVEQLLLERDLVISALKENLLIAQNRMKKQADSHRRELKFRIGGELKLKLGKAHQVQHLPPTLTEEFELQVEPEAVLGVRWNSELGANEWEGVLTDPYKLLREEKLHRHGSRCRNGLQIASVNELEEKFRRKGRKKQKEMFETKHYQR